MGIQMDYPNRLSKWFIDYPNGLYKWITRYPNGLWVSKWIMSIQMDGHSNGLLGT
jgi:hypothetical protein